MEPTIKAGEFVEVNFAAFKTKSPERWDLVAFEGPIDGKHIWLKRIVGLPGEEIDFDANGLLINGKSVSSPSKLGLAPYTLHRKKTTGLKLSAPEFPYKVPAGSYFVMGDNVENSLDSRYWGALESHKIVGKVAGK